MQLFATVLADVCYRLHAEVRGERSLRGHNALHYLQDLFVRRLAQGRCHRTPVLGWSEFTCSYWGEFREAEYEVDSELSLVIPSMLVSVWSRHHDGRFGPRFAQNVHISGGIMTFAE